jgi:probable F420-dependent oxidoreductase
MDVDISLDPQRPYDNLTKACRLAENLGISGLWNPENAHDGFLPLVIAATNTSRLELGTRVAIAFARSPMNMAYIAWDIQKLSNGRFILGLGSQVKGHIRRRFDMPWDAPAPRMKEYIQALRAIWGCWQNREPLDFNGRFYQFSLMPIPYTPEPIEHPHIPIYISVFNRYMSRVAGEMCDGVHLHPFHTPRYLRDVVVPEIENGARRAGRSIDDVALSLSLILAIGKNNAEIESAREKVRRQIAFYASTRTYSAFMEFNGWGDLLPKLHGLSIEGKWDDAAKIIPMDMVDSIGIVCQPDEVVPIILERYSGLVDRICFDLDMFEGQSTKFARDFTKRFRDNH